MKNDNLYAHFLFSEHKDNIFIITHDNRKYTYHDIHEQVGKYCNFLKNTGVNIGDRVIQQTDKSIEALCIYLACLRYGAIYIPLNPAFKAEEITYFIGDSKPALFICAPDKLNTIQQCYHSNKIDLVVETLDENGGGTITEKSIHLHSNYQIEHRKTDDIACILYTSGTTGKPKGAMLSHSNLLSNGLNLKKAWGFTEKDTLLHMLPIFHCHGLFFACHCVLLSGASMHFLAKFSVENAIKYLPKSSVLMGVPTYYTRLLANSHFNSKIVDNMRLFISGSAPLLENTFSDFEKITGHKILERYGMTETGINTSNQLNGDRIPGTVGLPLPGNELRLVNLNNEETLIIKSKVQGEIQVKGEHVFNGYWGKPEKTQESFTEDDFFKTGDIGIINENGFISIIGRAKDMIITGGINVYPKEIELIIDNIDGVKESAIIGLPHDDFGEAVVAVVVLDNTVQVTTEDIIQSVKTQLANYKVPKEVIFIDELPRNAMSKVQKNLLRKQFHNMMAES